MEKLHHIISSISQIVELLGVFIICVGVFKTLVIYLISEFRHLVNSGLKIFHNARIAIGNYLILGLDFMIAADIISTITDITTENLISLAGIVIIRTAIAWFLTREMEMMEKLEKEEEERGL